ncbi:TetR/AcrR family transcriptional regulator [Tolypothrix campylonemoides VB511288]|nr:TetR/AcrR family transcriptional regulator [Tolypothrix campylonemoides VB511288]
MNVSPAKSVKVPRQSRDPEATQAEILNAAEQEFAKQGFMAAKTEAIAAQTGVTKAMIYYYFASKEGLYKAMLERAFTKHLQPLEKFDFAQLSPEEALATFLREVLQQLSRNLNLATILFLEALQNKGKFYPQETGELLYGTLQRILERGIEEGCFRTLDPRHTAVNIMGTCVFYFSATDNLKFLWKGKRLLSKDMLQQHTQEAINLVLAGVRSTTEA